jgi:methyl-accepting chemotaxis protein
MLSNIKIGTRLIVSYLVMALIVCATGLIGLHYVSSVGHDGTTVGDELAPLGDATMEIKLAAAEAHLKFEEIMSGDEGEDVNYVYKRLDEAVWYCEAMLHGGKNSEGTYLPAKSEQVRSRVEKLEGVIESFKVLAQKR